MKIVFVCDTLGSGGAERVISTLSNEFSNIGHTIFIVMLSSGAAEPFYKINKDVSLIYLTRDLKKRKNIIKKSRLLKKCIKEIEPDAVIAFLSYVCIYTWWALRKTKIPYLVSERNNPTNRGIIKQFLLNLSFKRAAGCVFQTEDALSWYKKKLKKGYKIIYNPVVLDYFPSKNIHNRKKQILYVGRLTEQKNIFVLIDAFSIFNQIHKEYSLKIYGDGPLKFFLEEYIKEKSLSNHVFIFPSSNQWQNDEFDSSLFVLPSKFEGMPNVLSEALCLGIPSVSTNCPIGGPKELKKIFPDLLVLTDDFTPERIAEAMEKGLSISSKKSAIPDALKVTTIAKEWIDFINATIRNYKTKIRKQKD